MLPNFSILGEEKRGLRTAYLGVPSEIPVYGAAAESHDEIDEADLEAGSAGGARMQAWNKGSKRHNRSGVTWICLALLVIAVIVVAITFVIGLIVGTWSSGKNVSSRALEEPKTRLWNKLWSPSSSLSTKPEPRLDASYAAPRATFFAPARSAASTPDFSGSSYASDAPTVSTDKAESTTAPTELRVSLLTPSAPSSFISSSWALTAPAKALSKKGRGMQVSSPISDFSASSYASDGPTTTSEVSHQSDGDSDRESVPSVSSHHTAESNAEGDGSPSSSDSASTAESMHVEDVNAANNADEVLRTARRFGPRVVVPGRQISGSEAISFQRIHHAVGDAEPCTEQNYVFHEAGVIGSGSFGRSVRYAGMQSGCSDVHNSRVAAVVLSPQEQHRFGGNLELVVKMPPVGRHDADGSWLNAAVRGLRQEAEIYEIIGNQVPNVPHYFGFSDAVPGVRAEADMQLKMQLVPGAQPLRKSSGLTDSQNGHGNRVVTWPFPSLTPGSATVPAVSRLAEQLLIAYAGLAAKGIVHRDLHHGNLLVHDVVDVGSGNFKWMVIDFGLSQRTDAPIEYISAIIPARAPEELRAACRDFSNDWALKREMLRSERKKGVEIVKQGLQMNDPDFLNRPVAEQNARVRIAMPAVMSELNAVLNHGDCNSPPLRVGAAADLAPRANPKSDVFSLGYILLDLLCRSPGSENAVTAYPDYVHRETKAPLYGGYFAQYTGPYSLYSIPDFTDASYLRSQLQKCKKLHRPEYAVLVDLIGSMLNANVVERPNAADALEQLYSSGMIERP